MGITAKHIIGPTSVLTRTITEGRCGRHGGAKENVACVFYSIYCFHGGNNHAAQDTFKNMCWREKIVLEFKPRTVKTNIRLRITAV